MNGRPSNSKMLGSSEVIYCVHSDDEGGDSKDKMNMLNILSPTDTKPTKWLNWWYSIDTPNSKCSKIWVTLSLQNY